MRHSSARLRGSPSDSSPPGSPLRADRLLAPLNDACSACWRALLGRSSSEELPSALRSKIPHEWHSLPCSSRTPSVRASKEEGFCDLSAPWHPSILCFLGRFLSGTPPAPPWSRGAGHGPQQDSHLFPALHARHQSEPGRKRDSATFPPPGIRPSSVSSGGSCPARLHRGAAVPDMVPDMVPACFPGRFLSGTPPRWSRGAGHSPRAPCRTWSPGPPARPPPSVASWPPPLLASR